VLIRLLGGLDITHDGRSVPVTGAMQLAVLFRLAVDAGTAVSYRAISEDVWSRDAPENTRAALQSIVSRLRAQLPPATIESTSGGYRLRVARPDVDALRFADLVAEAAAATSVTDARHAARAALALWTGEPWVPSPEFDWFLRDLARDKATALELAAAAPDGPGDSARNDAAAPGGDPAQAARLIPVSLTPLIGRERELAAIRSQLAVSRLVTVIGTGGAGKTRLAVETAGAIRGSVLVELAPVGPGDVLAAVLAATGRELRTTDASVEPVGTLERVVEALLGRQVLLVVDNCEHVIDVAARLAETLLGALPGLTILATSREPLGVPGEAFVTVGPLGHPSEADLEADAALSEETPVHLRDYAALQLIGQRAIAARGTALTDDELIVAAHICVRLDGLPLALELAAAKLRTMSMQEILSGLDSRFTLLTGGYRTVLPRHQTLRALIDWSWSLLSTDERTALGRLAVYPAGINSRDAADVASGAGLTDASVFESLVDKSLLQRERGRYRLLETIREYGIERLAEAGTLAAEREAQADYAAERAQAADALMRGPRILEAIEWFDAEDDNVIAALRYATSAGRSSTAVRLVVACSWYWVVRDRHDELRGWFSAIGDLAADVDSDEARALVLFTPVVRAFASAGTGPDDLPDTLVEEARNAFDTWARQPPAQGGELIQLVFPLLSAFSTVLGQDSWMLRVAVPRGEELGLGAWPCAMLHVIRAATAQNRGDITELGEASASAVRAFEANGDLWGLALAQQIQAEWLSLLGRLDEALALTETATGNMFSISSSGDLVQQQALSVSIMLRQGRPAAARERSDRLLADSLEGGNILAVVLAEATAAYLDVAEQKAEPLRARLARIDAFTADWPAVPRQVVAMIELRRSALLLLEGDADAAERAVHLAAGAAIASLDHPVIGQVALGLGSLALARGDAAGALRALDLSAAIIGAYDRLEPQAIAIEAAAATAGVYRTSPEVSSRWQALDILRELVDAGTGLPRRDAAR